MSSQINLPAEVLGALNREGELNVHEIARAVYADTDYHAESYQIEDAIQHLADLGYCIIEYEDGDGMRYELEEG